ncbi:MAG TPA: ribonuclease III [Accumulibacter sp.]|nr:ribonuclease III [Accumulibacter sp.]HMW17017.1 ribonuclease III [Accumulibacter sp.]HNC17269.1 ribonuclease III [Accumulibacter sp.]HND79837.1 ribonuclease III [Accumulibacter sp.]HNE13992.1 ribonuclease III [Accumulibacter sp.]
MSEGRLQESLGYWFRDRQLLQTALTHRSFSFPHNERLEFLGDAALNAAIGRQLFERFPSLPEGELSRLRAQLVCQDSLFQLASALSLGNHLRLGEGELKSGGHQRPSILGDALEALFGAIWLDGGFDRANETIERLYRPQLDRLVPGQRNKDAKTRLQEHLQGRKMPLPQYQLLRTTGEAHAQSFTVACIIDALCIRTEGGGPSRRSAEQVAAERAMTLLESP